jgi:hypothetical protein
MARDCARWQMAKTEFSINRRRMRRQTATVITKSTEKEKENIAHVAALHLVAAARETRF